MKTILISVQVPDNLTTKEAVICLNDFDWKEIHIPDWEEINLASFVKPKTVWQKCFRDGANWMLTRLDK